MSGDSLACRGCGQAGNGCRGCCPRCYAGFRKRVKSGETTWAELEARGEVLPAQPQGARGRWAKGFDRLFVRKGDDVGGQPPAD